MKTNNNMSRIDLVQQSINFSAQLRELAANFDLVKKVAEDERQDLDVPTLRTLARIFTGALDQIAQVKQVANGALDLLELEHTFRLHTEPGHLHTGPGHNFQTAVGTTNNTRVTVKRMRCANRHI